MPVTRESASSLLSPHDSAPSARGNDLPAFGRTDAVVAEIPVIVIASRYAGTQQADQTPRSSVREETRTTIVFRQGAVVYLTATVTLGQLVVLTNQQSGKDTLCRVVNVVVDVKEQSGIQNLVDLEFTQRAPSFWGDSLGPEHPVRNESPAPALEVPAAATSAAATKPLPRPQAASTPTLEVEPAALNSEPPTSASESVGVPDSSVDAQPPDKPAASAPFSNVTLGMRSSSLGELLVDKLSGVLRYLFGARRSNSKKGPWTAAMIVIFIGLTAAEGFLLLHRPSAPRTPPVANDAQKFAELTRDALHYSETHSYTTEDGALSHADAAAAQSAGQLEAPTPVYSPAPAYPATARAQNVEGAVLIDALIDAAGKVTQMQVVSGPMPLRQAAMDALRDWKYQPARLNGQPIAVHANVDVSFTTASRRD